MNGRASHLVALVNEPFKKDIEDLNSSLTFSIDWYDVVNVAALADISEKDFFFYSHPDPDHHRAAFRRMSVINLTLETNKKILSSKAIPELQTISDMRRE